MNLGDIYVKTFLAITAIAFVAGYAVAFILRRMRRVQTSSLVVPGLLLAVVLTVIGNAAFHQKLFTAWHQSQNSLVPQTECLTYNPSFGHLYATYSMDAPTFEQFVASHPWELKPYDSSFEANDAQQLGFDTPTVAYATKMATNGSQLRVYFEDGTMFLSYNAL